MEPLHLRIYRSCADTAGNEDISLALELLLRHFSKVRRDAERSDNILEGLSLLEGNDF